MRLQVFKQNNSKQISFDTRQSGRRDIILRNATIFWRFKNIKKNNNDTITDALETRIDIISEGYHSFQDLQEIFKANNITMSSNFQDNTCSITPTVKNIKLGNLGMMLGFAEDHTFTKDVQSDGTNPVDVHHGLRYVKLRVMLVLRGREVKCLPHFLWKPHKDYFQAEQYILTWISECPLLGIFQQ